MADKNIIRTMNLENRRPEIKMVTGAPVADHGIRPHIRQDVKFTTDYAGFYEILKRYNKGLAKKFKEIGIPEEVDDSHFDSPSGWMTFSMGSNHIDLKDEYAAAIKKRLASGRKEQIGISVVGFSDIPDFLQASGLRFDAEMPMYSSKKKKVKYPVFKSENYCVINPGLEGISNIYVENKNIPYEYYSKLPINQEAFSQNLKDGSPRLFGFTLDEAEKNSWNEYKNENISFFIDVTNNALTMTGATSEMIAIASYFGFPTIPVSFILLGAETDILGRKRRWHNISKDETNKACAPYIELL